jgi:hypothetical protein
MDSDSTKDGLVEGVGLELSPYPPPPAGGQPSNAPMQPQDGQWTLRFNYSDPASLSVFVTVSFGPPFAPTAELSADMTKLQVGNLRDWLTRILTSMSGPTPPPPPPPPPPNTT